MYCTTTVVVAANVIKIKLYLADKLLTLKI